MDLDFTWGQLEQVDFLWLIIMLVCAVWPFISSAKNETSIALAMVLSLLLVHFVHFALTVLKGSYFGFDPVQLLSVIPVLSSEPSHFHRMVTAAWLHSDFLHVLGNIMVIALAGVPLEQRLGAKRWIIVYFVGFLGGNIAWILTHPDSSVPAIGASGAAFGILGAYMACWPDDEVMLPLIFLIRTWPVWVIAFVKLGLEIFHIYYYQTGTRGETEIAHMAHVGGFFLAYILARPIARGGPSPLGEPGMGMSGTSLADELRKQATARMGDLSEDPWKEEGRDLEGTAARILSRLRKEGDELETRRAWLEELSEHTICPKCEGELVTVEERGVCRIVCSLSSEHIRWP